MRRGSTPSEPSITLMFWSSTIWWMWAPSSSAPIAETSTISLVRTSSRNVTLSFGGLRWLGGARRSRDALAASRRSFYCYSRAESELRNCGDRRGGNCPLREPPGGVYRPAGRPGCRRHGTRQRHHPVADRFRSHHDPGGRQPSDLLRGKTAAPDADAGDGASR